MDNGELKITCLDIKNHQWLKIADRKENHFKESYIAITKDGKKAIELKLYLSSGRSFACLWINYNGIECNSSAHLNRCSFSSVADIAFGIAGVHFQNLDGRNTMQIENAMI
jgi:hypothetical protein